MLTFLKWKFAFSSNDHQRTCMFKSMLKKGKKKKPYQFNSSYFFNVLVIVFIHFA